MDFAPSPSPSAPPLGPAAFSHWLQACGHNPWSPLTAEAAKPYGFIWQAWLKYLAGQGAHGTDWTQASAVQLLDFINHHPQSPKRDTPSDITRRRYWRVLDRIYDHAYLHGWVSANPAQAIASADLPPSEDPQGAILSPRMWRALRATLPTEEDLIGLRDRAILLLLMELGLTPQEVRYLRLEHLVYATGSAGPIAALRIEGERDRQSRTLPVSSALDQALHQWLGARNSYHAMQGQPALFCTRKAPELSNHTLLHLVTKTLRVAAQRHQLPTPPRMGPQIIRNTVLVQWLEAGVSVDEVLARAGMKHPNALLHLRAYWNAPDDASAP